MLQPGTLATTRVISSTAVLCFVAAIVKNFVQLQLRKEERNKKQLRFHGNKPEVGKVIGTIKEVNVFPGKSMAACSLKKCEVTNLGLKGDRLTMVVKGKYLVPTTQRMIPQLSRISATLTDTGVTLSTPTSSPLHLDLSKVDDKADSVVIDLFTVKAGCVDLGNEAADWINDALTKLCGSSKSGYRMFTLAPKELRRVHGTPAALLMEDARTFDATLLSDLAPITFASEASLLALNKEATQSVPMDRFRANLVAEIKDSDLAFLEDHILKLKVGDLVLRAMGPTPRCVIPSIDQATGEAGFRKNFKSAEPIATLKRLRSGGLRFGLSGLLPIPMAGSKSLAPVFGAYMGADHPESSGVVSVGDSISVLEYKREPGLVAQLIDALAITIGLDRAA